MSNSEASVRAEALESLLIDKGLIDLGPLRIIIVAVIMLVVTMVTHEGLTGAREQFRAFRKRKSGERRARRTIKGGEVMPEEATEIYDKQEIYYRRFNKRLRDHLKTLITPELVKEHQDAPQGKHSDQLSRVLNFFRRGEMPDKYVIMRLKEGQDKYSVMAVSGVKGTPPRVVDDKIYENLNEAYHAVFLLRVNDLLES